MFTREEVHSFEVALYST